MRSCEACSRRVIGLQTFVAFGGLAPVVGILALVAGIFILIGR